MITRIIYDNLGKIISQIHSPNESDFPSGVPYLDEAIPEGKYPISIDVSSREHAVIYGDLPKSEITQLREEIDTLVLELTMLIYGGGI